VLFSASKLCAVNVTFQVDLSQMTVSSDGVYIAGDFQGWNPGITPMIHLGNGIYSITLDLPPGSYEYKFINGNNWGPDELVPQTCGVDDGFLSYNREVSVGAMDQVNNLVCYGQCAACSNGLYTLNGDAFALGGDCYAITGSMEWQNGTVWYGNQLDLSQPFDLQFLINLGVEDVNGADGVVFALQRLSSTAIGASGGGMGFQSFGTSFGIEFDTFENPEFSDLPVDHLSAQINGDVTHYTSANIAGPVQLSSISANVEDNADHVVQIAWNPTTFLMQVFFDCELRLSFNYDVSSSIFSGQKMVYWGFTGATGLFYNNQQVCLQSNAIQVNELSMCPGGAVQLSGGSSSLGTWLWSPADFLDDPNSSNPQASPPITTVYEVTLTDLCGNLITRVVTVTVLENNLACSLVPVTVIDFDARSIPPTRMDEVEWITLSSVNHSRYLVERSFDGLTFTTVAEKQGLTAQWFPEHYQTTLPAPAQPCYYRLSEVDSEGTTTIVSPLVFVLHHPSEIVHVALQSGKTCIVSGLQTNANASSYSSSGQLLQRQALQAWNECAVSLPEGLVVLVIQAENGELLFVERYP